MLVLQADVAASEAVERAAADLEQAFGPIDVWVNGPVAGAEDPQFDWVKGRMPHRGQPVPPIFQPEVAGDAIVWAAAANRREVYVGYPTVVAIVGNMLMPGVGDRYLARHGFDSQQTLRPTAQDVPATIRARSRSSRAATTAPTAHPKPRRGGGGGENGNDGGIEDSPVM